MALKFGAAVSDRVAYSTAIPAFTSCSVALWFKLTTLATFKALFARGTGRPVIRFDNALSDELLVRWTGDVANLNHVTNNADLTVNKWWYIGVSINPAGSAGEGVNVLLGDLITPATERTYGTATDAVLPQSNSGFAAVFGNNESADSAVSGDLAIGWLWPDVILTHGEFSRQQFQKAPVRPGARIVTEFGEFGTGVQHDRSGYGNYGTVTGATYARAPELDTIFMPKRRLWTPSAVAAAAAFPDHYYRMMRVA